MNLKSTLLGLTLVCGAPVALAQDMMDADQPAEMMDINLDEELKDYELPALWLGADAPKLEIRRTLKGDSFNGFNPGMVYVVEAWATWCGPCIAAFPHVSELQEKYQGKVQVLGVNIWDEDTSDADLDEFVEGQGERMGYTVVRQAVEESEDETVGLVERDWMAAADQRGIPAAFIVDQRGMIAWIGHPMGMDEALDNIVEGKYDLDAEAKKAATTHRAEAWQERFFELMGEGDTARVRAIAHQLYKTEFSESESGLGTLMMVMSNMPDATDEDKAFAVKAGTKACELGEWNEWLPIAQLGLTHGEMDNFAEGIRLLELAKEKCPDEGIKEQIDSIVAEMRANAEEKAETDG